MLRPGLFLIRPCCEPLRGGLTTIRLVKIPIGHGMCVDDALVIKRVSGFEYEYGNVVMGNTMIENSRMIEIKETYIELHKLLKFENLVQNGCEAKHLVSEGLVKVNGGVETRKRKKIYSGDIVEFNKIVIRVKAKE